MPLLVTGFADTQAAPNASGRLIQSFIDDLPPELADLSDRLHFELIYTDFEDAESQRNAIVGTLDNLLEQVKPSVCLFTGQAPWREKITIERAAINLFGDKRIEPDGPGGYWATLYDIQALPGVLAEKQIPAGHSQYAGSGVRNLLLYSCLHQSATQHLAIRAGLVLFPLSPELAEGQWEGSPTLPSEVARQGLTEIIRFIGSHMD